MRKTSNIIQVEFKNQKQYCKENEENVYEENVSEKEKSHKRPLYSCLII